MTITKSISNLRQIGIATNMFVTEANGYYPALSDEGWSGNYWTYRVMPYLPSETLGDDEFITTSLDPVGEAFMDPLLDTGEHHPLGDYGANTSIMRRPNLLGTMGEVPASLIDNPSKLVLAMTAQIESRGKTIGAWYVNAPSFISQGYSSTSCIPSERDTGEILVVFCDGHASAIESEVFYDRRRELLLLEP